MKQPSVSGHSKSWPMTPNLNRPLINCSSPLELWCGIHRGTQVAPLNKCVHQCSSYQCVLVGQQDPGSPSLSIKAVKSPRTIASWRNYVPNWVFASQNWKIRILMIQELTSRTRLPPSVGSWVQASSLQCELRKRLSSQFWILQRSVCGKTFIATGSYSRKTLLWNI